MTRLLYDAHIDEIGFVITENTDGYCKAALIGAVDQRALPASEIVFYPFGAAPVYAVVSNLAPHLSKNEKKEILEPRDLFIDAGGVEVPVGAYGVMKKKSFSKQRILLRAGFR